ncbi:hypothetical protein, partial [Acrocarpospora corrugata]|uniref:hypothetical protein n=1 Tax=Acrocarpospora corrugata TaxID=35763 RepID=UPI001C3FEE57
TDPAPAPGHIRHLYREVPAPVPRLGKSPASPAQPLTCRLVSATASLIRHTTILVVHHDHLTQTTDDLGKNSLYGRQRLDKFAT